MAAVATLANIKTAQELFHEKTGRFGSFQDLTGAEPPLLSTAFNNVDVDRVRRSGYWFRIVRSGGTWRAYAWPIHPGEGTREFYVVDAIRPDPEPLRLDSARR